LSFCDRLLFVGSFGWFLFLVMFWSIHDDEKGFQNS
jgi:hypothetical protein